MLASEQALDLVLHGIWVDMLGFAGVEMHRRILGLAHNADFETIEDAGPARPLRNQGPETGTPPRGEPQPHSQHYGNQ